MALYLVGGIFGSLSCIRLGDMLGRRWVIALSSGVSIIGAVLMASSFSLAQFIVARLVLGLGTGGYVATVPVWHAELSKPSKRGGDVVTAGFFIGLGIAFSLWIDFGLYFVHGSSVSWRLPLALQILLSLVVIGSIFLLPESPRWLMKKGRLEEARVVLAALEDAMPESPSIDNDLTRIQSSLDHCRSASFWDIFKPNSQRLLHRTILAVLGQTFQQINGINALSFYATTIFEQYLHLSPTQSRILAASMATTQPVGGVIAYIFIDRFGRRRLMLSAAACMMALMAILAGTTSASQNQPALIVAVIALFLFPFIFTIGFAGLTFLYATEVAPTQYRASINALSTAAVWTSNFLLAQVTPVGFDKIGYRYYIVFAVINAVIIPVVYFLFPETSGLNLEDIDDIFGNAKGWLDPVGIARRMIRRRRECDRNVIQGAEGDVEVLEIGKGGPEGDERAEKE